MEKEENPIYERNTLEFVTVALEYCTFVETAGNTGLFDFVDKATKLLPLLYLKASLLPEVNLKRKPNSSFPFQKTCTSRFVHG